MAVIPQQFFYSYFLINMSSALSIIRLKDRNKIIIFRFFFSSSPPYTPTTPNTPTTPMTPISPGASPGAAKHTCNHLHTIGGLGGHKNICTRCSQKKWPLMRKLSTRKPEQRRSHHGEVTVLAVGRWVKTANRVTTVYDGIYIRCVELT